MRAGAVIDLLRSLDFTPDDHWLLFDRANVRVALNDGEARVIVFTRDVAKLFCWSVTFTSETPSEVVTATLGVALLAAEGR